MMYITAKRIGLSAMSAKPFHRGHDTLIRSASKECDEVRVFVSLTDRKRPGELPILGSDMDRIWHELIEPALPNNIRVEYGGEPVGRIWTVLGAASEVNSPDTFVVYGDETDLTARFKPASLKKYAPNLDAAGRIELRRTDRITSATAVRRSIAAGDFESFRGEMPAWMDAKRAWDILTHQAHEGLLRRYVRDLVRTSA